MRYIVNIGLVVAITIFIFSNSFDDYTASKCMSDTVSEIVLPHEYAIRENVSLLVRKIAHLLEYAVLGISVMLSIKFNESISKKLCAWALFYVLFIAVIDEHIQSFSDRISSTKDILLDFCGALIGFAIVIITHYIYSKIKKKKRTGSGV